MAILATKKFILKSNNSSDIDVTLEMFNSGAFAYGNRHSLVLTIDDSVSHYDVRYDHRFDSVESFNKNAHDFVKDCVRDDLEIVDI